MVQCRICLEPYNEQERVPVVLGCGHSFCASCVGAPLSVTAYIIKHSQTPTLSPLSQLDKQLSRAQPLRAPCADARATFVATRPQA